MKKRINPHEKGHAALKAFNSFGMYFSKATVEQKLLNLIYFRVSQINGCAFCLDMHSKDLRLKGETEQRLYMLDAWKETSIYSARERAALAWAEEVTKINGGQVPDKVYEEALTQFNEDELIELTAAVIAINGYNRVNIAFSVPSGHYDPAHAW
ncbi:MAG: carboxymuconolactone decarboxylase family protein [Sporocytophaga sp.]|uniref:carboxymuconolactone decarboxylase family protein n=1 Tax=Sporocytophaga sp. TaxID=2231183 RepID=UPI001B1FC8C2|nr:carboxymuconolactone decarboxylase family protein [Sporocytophaga sp.]MBO9703297.1 carboxymuconolactone decarboxylase family protein [Sporocytophaga sp.]